MSSVINSIPVNFLVGLAGVSLATPSYSSGEISHIEEFSNVRSDYKYEDVTLYKKETYSINHLVKSFNNTTKVFINQYSGLESFINESISKLKGYFVIFSHNIDIYEDPNESYSQVKITIYSMDENKIESFCNFIDEWVESVPVEFEDKILFEIG